MKEVRPGRLHISSGVGVGNRIDPTQQGDLRVINYSIPRVFGGGSMPF